MKGNENDGNTFHCLITKKLLTATEKKGRVDINPMRIVLPSTSYVHKYYTLLHICIYSLTVRINFAYIKCIEYDLIQKYFTSNFSRNEMLGIDNRHTTSLMKKIIFLIARIILNTNSSVVFDNNTLYVIQYN